MELLVLLLISSHLSDETTTFDISNHVFCVDEPMTMEDISQYCREQTLVRYLSCDHAGSLTFKSSSVASHHFFKSL